MSEDVKPQCEFCWMNADAPKTSFMWHKPEAHTEEHAELVRQWLTSVQERP